MSKIKVICEGKVITELEKINIDTLLDIARKCGLRCFYVKDDKGHYIERSEFPLTPKRTKTITLIRFPHT